MNNKVVITRKDEIKGKEKVGTDQYIYKKYEVTKRSDFSQCYVAFYDVPPKKASYPKHYHKYNTECFYFISGKAKIEGNNKEYHVNAGDIAIFPPGEEGIHKIINESDSEVLVYLDVDTTNSPDIIKYIDSNKIGIIEHNISSSFYRESDQVDYYDGE